MRKRQCLFFVNANGKDIKSKIFFVFFFFTCNSTLPIRSIKSKILLLALACGIGCQTFIFALIILRICPWKMC
jgi:hypothetical protein